MGAEPAAPGAKGAHARRLYLAAFWPLLAIAVGVPVQQGLLQLHDRLVAAADHACLAGSASGAAAGAVPGGPDAAARCHLERAADGALRSTRAWRAELAGPPQGPEAAESLRRALDLSAVAVAPVFALVLLRRYFRWVAGPPAEAAPPR